MFRDDAVGSDANRSRTLPRDKPQSSRGVFVTGGHFGIGGLQIRNFRNPLPPASSYQETFVARNQPEAAVLGWTQDGHELRVFTLQNLWLAGTQLPEFPLARAVQCAVVVEGQVIELPW